MNFGLALNSLYVSRKGKSLKYRKTPPWVNEHENSVCLVVVVLGPHLLVLTLDVTHTGGGQEVCFALYLPPAARHVPRTSGPLHNHICAYYRLPDFCFPLQNCNLFHLFEKTELPHESDSKSTTGPLLGGPPLFFHGCAICRS